jgi:hypothetical protein
VRCEFTVGEFPWLVVTPRKPSLAQLVRDSGWRCYIAGAYELVVEAHDKKARVSVRNVHATCVVTLTGQWAPTIPDQHDFAYDVYLIRLDADGYPIVEAAEGGES